jgi:hypothetical protein
MKTNMFTWPLHRSAFLRRLDIIPVSSSTESAIWILKFLEAYVCVHVCNCARCNSSVKGCPRSLSQCTSTNTFSDTLGICLILFCDLRIECLKWTHNGEVIPVFLSVCPYASFPKPHNGFIWNFVWEVYSKIYRTNLILSRFSPLRQVKLTPNITEFLKTFC